MLAPHIFRAYDIRGIFASDFDAAGAELIARGYATHLRRTDGLTAPRIALGRDGRLSGDELHAAFVRGLVASGCVVTDIGLATSPLLNFAICHAEFDGGVSITASHNPAEYNGFKLQRHAAHAVCGDEIQQILQLINAADFDDGMGSVVTADFADDYFAAVLRVGGSAPADTRYAGASGRHKIVIDCGNGVAGKFAPQCFRQLGYEVVELYTEVDGNFPNHPADPEVEANLADLKMAVHAEEADLGIAFDGDGDRVGLVDCNGRAYVADLLLVLLARDLLTRHGDAKVVLDLKATAVLFDDIRARGGEAIMVATGHSFVEQKMSEVGALLGGEVSGHIFCAEDYYGFDDAFVAAAKLLRIVLSSGKTPAELISDLPPVFNTPEIKLECEEARKFTVVARLVKKLIAEFGADNCLTIDGVRFDAGDGAWGIVRASNTSPKLTLRFEARTQAALDDLQARVMPIVEVEL